MKPKHTSAAEGATKTPIGVVLLTLDNHVSAALDSAFVRLRPVIPGLQLSIHVSHLVMDPKDVVLDIAASGKLFPA